MLHFSESNERLQVHLKERMHSLEEKNHLSNELERTKKKLEEAGTNKARLQAELAELKQNLRFLKICLSFFCLQADMQKELQKTRLEIENVRRQMLQQEIHFNIQQTEALTRYSTIVDYNAWFWVTLGTFSPFLDPFINSILF